MVKSLYGSPTVVAADLAVTLRHPALKCVTETNKSARDGKECNAAHSQSFSVPSHEKQLRFVLDPGREKMWAVLLTDMSKSTVWSVLTQRANR